MLTFILTMKTSGNTAKPPSSTLLAIIYNLTGENVSGVFRKSL